MRGLATLRQSNQELFVVKVKFGIPLGELGVIVSMKCDAFSFSDQTLLVG